MAEDIVIDPHNIAETYVNCPPVLGMNKDGMLQVTFMSERRTPTGGPAPKTEFVVVARIVIDPGLAESLAHGIFDFKKSLQSSEPAVKN